MKLVSRLISRKSFTIFWGLWSMSDIVLCFGLRVDTSSLDGVLCNSCKTPLLKYWITGKKVSSCKLWPSINIYAWDLNKTLWKKFLMLVCFCGHNYSSCNNVLALIWFWVGYGSGMPCCSEMCNLSAVILPVITFQRHSTLATSGQTRCIALVLRLTKFQNIPPGAIKLKPQTLEITSGKCM